MTESQKVRILAALQTALGIAAASSFPVTQRIYLLMKWLAKRATRG